MIKKLNSLIKNNGDRIILLLFLIFQLWYALLVFVKLSEVKALLGYVKKGTQSANGNIAKIEQLGQMDLLTFNYINDGVQTNLGLIYEKTSDLMFLLLIVLIVTLVFFAFSFFKRGSRE